MAEIVCGFTVPHVPMLCGAPDAPDKDQADRCWAAFDHVRSRMKDESVDTVIIIGDDHYTIFSPTCLPSALIGIGDISGPVEPWLKTPKTRIQNNSELAQHIMRYGHKNGVDWAVAKSLEVDHGVYVPYHYGVKPNEGMRTIPIYLATGVEPLIDSRRCYQIGQNIAAAVAGYDGADRVAVFGTGGGAHWPGTHQMQRLEPEYDEGLLKLLEAGDFEALIAMGDDQILAEAGNGAWEMKNWLCMLGCMGDATGKIIAYEAVPQWMGSCAFVEMEMAA